MILPIDEIQPNPDQPRRHFAEDSLRELSDSIRTIGLLQPVAVHSGDIGWVIVAGERRWRAARMAGLTEIPVIIIEDQDEESLFVKSIAENVNRADMTVIEEADAYQRLIEAGWEVERIARFLGKRPQDIRWKLDLVGLDPAVRGVVATGQLPADLSWYLSQISGTRQVEVVRKWSAGEFANVRTATAYCEAVKLADGQEFIFSIEEIPEVTVKQQRVRAKTRDRLAMIGKAMEQLEELFGDEDADLAHNLGPEAERLRIELEGLHRLIGRFKTRAVKVEQMVNAGIGQGSLLNSGE